MEQEFIMREVQVLAIFSGAGTFWTLFFIDYGRFYRSVAYVMLGVCIFLLSIVAVDSAVREGLQVQRPSRCITLDGERYCKP
jgi:cell division protein FtsW (lipid II flippase)